jgi:hypothetical protein
LGNDELREERQYYRRDPITPSTMGTTGMTGAGLGSSPNYPATGTTMGDAAREKAGDVKRAWREGISNVKEAGDKLADEGRELRAEAADQTRRMTNTAREDETRRRRSRVYDHIKY